VWSDFERDFKGRVKGLAFAVYKWLGMRQGVETIKPDTHVKNFLRRTTGRAFSDHEAVSILERVAKTSLALRMNLIGAFGKRSATRVDLRERSPCGQLKR
jgi:hypothetical protein